MIDWILQSELAAIALLLTVVAIVVARLPRLDLGHSDVFRKRRVLNWLPLGLTYAFLYMGRYNVTVSKNALGDLMTKADFGTIFFWGTLTYGCSFVINGPIADRFGGRRTILIAAAGAAVMNILMGLVTWSMLSGGEAAAADSVIAQNLVVVFSLLYAGNMYFQSFGAVSIVKVNASWFHVRERGVFGGIFGILISLGIYFAFDWGGYLVDFAEGLKAADGSTWNHAPVYLVFFVPAAILLLFFVIDFFVVRDTPGQTGHKDFDTADASSGDDGPQKGPLEVAIMMAKNPVIVVIAMVEFCSGFLRNAIMQWYIIFAKQTGIMAQAKIEITLETFVAKHWGMLLCCAGIMGGVFAGTISDRVFQSRRGPVAGILYGGMVLGALGLCFLLGGPLVGWVVIAMSLCVIGVHGMLAGTASMDFGGTKNVGVAVGLIDGMVYLGTAGQAILYGQILPKGDAAKDPSNWIYWPLAMIPLAIVGSLLAMRLWNAKPQPKKRPAAGDAEVIGDPIDPIEPGEAGDQEKQDLDSEAESDA